MDSYMAKDREIRDHMLWDKLNAYLDKSGGCWIWTGFVEKDGYGRIYEDLYPSDISKVMVHRVMYHFKIGDLIKGMVITQTCGNKLCCNPKHLAQVTRKEVSANGKKTHCVRGHVLPAPKKVGEREIRVCPECNRIRQAEYRKSKSEVLPFD
jgi:hypothetical protein